MNKSSVYFHEKINRIPAGNVRQMVETELRDLSFDLGKRVSPGEADFDYLVNRVTQVLTSQYGEWEMSYFDNCMKCGMLDEYDKGQSLTVKRLFVWLSSYDRGLKHLFVQQNEGKSEYDEKSIERFMANGGRFPAIILFRQQHKPDYDAEHWSLAKIEETEAFKAWNVSRNGRMNPITTKIGRRV